MLVVYRGAELFQLLCKIFSTGFVCRSIGYAGTEVYLLLDIPVSAVCIELGYADRALGLFSLTVGIAFAFIAARYHRYEQQQ